MKKNILIIFCLFIFQLCYGQNNVSTLVENAVFSREEKALLEAYNSIIQCRCVRSSNKVEVADIANALKKEEVAIEFFELPKSSGGTTYFAFVLKNGMSTPRLYNICNDDALLVLLDDSCKFYNDTRVLSAIISPLVNELQDTKTVYYTPSGKLHKIALEYCMDTNGKMFCENYNVYRLTSSAMFANKNEKKVYRNYSVWAGTELDAELPYGDADDTLEPYRNPFEYLEDSYKAADIISQELTSKNKNVKFWHNADATEPNFKTMSGQNIDAFLIETHGIFTKDCCVSPRSGNTAPLDNHALALYGASFVMDAGIVPAGNEDGLITENEIAQLDFSSMDLAVISACKSGLGDIQWDGVHGLMLGFKLAGVNSLVMTLDDVVDYVSGQLWIQFFRNLNNGQSKREALLNGIKYIRTMDNGAYSHPKYWTPFVLIDGIE